MSSEEGTAKTVLVFGANGMLGRYVCKWLREQGHNVRTKTRNEIDLASSLQTSEVVWAVEGVDYVVNCAGIIKQRTDTNMMEMILVNSVFPHTLERICYALSAPLIHITTDCVFSGNREPGDEFREYKE